MMRPIVAPNFNFLGQLLDYEKQLNLTTSPTTSTAGNKRKRLNMSLPLNDACTATDSPQHSKRLVVENNNSLSSLSPASALAGLKFEHSITPPSCPLPGPSSSVESTVAAVEIRQRQPLPHHLSPAAASSDLLPPPKRCHSWNGLADLATSPTSSAAGGSTSPLLSPKLRKIGGGGSRPRSLNLSMSSLSVPPAVLELNAKVDSELSRQRRRLPLYSSSSADNILELSEAESEPSLSASNSGTSLSCQDLTDVTPSAPQCLVFHEIESSLQIGTTTQQLVLTRDASSSNPSLSPATPTIAPPRAEARPQLEMAMSQPLLKTFQSSLEQLRTSITSAHTAPSDLSKVVVVEGSAQEVRRRSYSLSNLISPCGEAGASTSAPLCMKCGRVDKLNLCHGAMTPTSPDYLTRPRSMHDSLEMIQVL